MSHFTPLTFSVVDNTICSLYCNSAVTVSDPLEQLVRHFLIETGPRGVKIKGCQNEPYFGKFFLSGLRMLFMCFFLGKRFW